MRNCTWDRRNSNTRPLPSCCPELIPVEIHRSEFRGREQWGARYPVYGNGRASDWVDIVVNVGRFSRDYEWQDGDTVWVRPTAMAAQKRLIFAQYVGHCDFVPRELFPHRVDTEFIGNFVWDNQEKCYVSVWGDEWHIAMKTELKLEQYEQWKVRVVRVGIGWVDVEPVGPGGEQVVVAAPEELAYLEVKNLQGKPLAFEGDVTHYLAAAVSGFEAVVETDDDVVVISCTDLRQRSRADTSVIGTVTLSGRQYGQLCEFVWVEGSPTTNEMPWRFLQRREAERRRTNPTQEEIEQDEWERELEMQRIDWEYRQEVLDNEERPGYDYDPLDDYVEYD